MNMFSEKVERGQSAGDSSHKASCHANEWRTETKGLEGGSHPPWVRWKTSTNRMYFQVRLPPWELVTDSQLHRFAKMEVNKRMFPPSSPQRENTANPAYALIVCLLLGFFLSYTKAAHDYPSQHAPLFHCAVLINTGNVSPEEANLVAVDSFLPCLHLIRCFFLQDSAEKHIIKWELAYHLIHLSWGAEAAANGAWCKWGNELFQNWWTLRVRLCIYLSFCKATW